MDLPAKFMGPSHRRVLHSLPESILIGYLLSGKAEGALSGALHVLADNAQTTVKKQINKELRRREKNGKEKEKKN
jgi:hypothetical protein